MWAPAFIPAPRRHSCFLIYGLGGQNVAKCSETPDENEALAKADGISASRLLCQEDELSQTPSWPAYCHHHTDLSRCAL